ncbi:hypothetical protein COU54_02550 [Candidatus Pacearchaeota archaeon CG10_big_fil_rev_8_21_14_0_10_31_24]|nr:MAG: hypothetical protein COU54_02550 [Candidatus Pacearchaeota archaeon CG10_big_fil_rev_8_21_14_0_10_31_24]
MTEYNSLLTKKIRSMANFTNSSHLFKDQTEVTLKLTNLTLNSVAIMHADLAMALNEPIPERGIIGWYASQARDEFKWTLRYVNNNLPPELSRKISTSLKNRIRQVNKRYEKHDGEGITGFEELRPSYTRLEETI